MRFLLLLLASLLAARTVVAQRFESGAFVTLGGQSASQAVAGSGGSGVEIAGAYAEGLRPRIHPGLEVRGVSAGGSLDGPLDNGVSGVLTGPRASMSLAHFHPYIAALFGPTRAYADGPSVLLPGQMEPDLRRDGVTKQATVGLDADWRSHWRIRLFEFSQSWFSGLPDSHPFEVSFGIVLHTR